MRCIEPHVRAEALDKQLSALLLGFSLPTAWADKLRDLMRKDELSEKAEYSANTELLRNDTAQLSSKLQRLLDSYLDGDVERELYQDKRAEILGQKKRLEEKIEQTTVGVLIWVEPMKRWIETGVSICKVAKSDDLLAKKSLCLEIFGSNLKMQNKNVVVNDDQFLHSPQENIWSALRAAKEKAARQGDQFQFCSELVRVRRVELLSQPWEGHIIAVIRYPHRYKISIAEFDSRVGHDLGDICYISRVSTPPQLGEDKPHPSFRPCELPLAILTPVSTLGRSHNSRYTIPASGFMIAKL